jgi:hypothetical protein
VGVRAVKSCTGILTIFVRLVSRVHVYIRILGIENDWVGAFDADEIIISRFYTS